MYHQLLALHWHVMSNEFTVLLMFNNRSLPLGREGDSHPWVCYNKTGMCFFYNSVQPAECGHRMAHRKWKETKQEPGTAGPGNMLGCCLVSFHFLWGKLSTLTVGLEIGLLGLVADT